MLESASAGGIVRGSSCPLVIQSQQTLQDFRVTQGKRPPVGGKNRFVEFAMGMAWRETMRWARLASRQSVTISTGNRLTFAAGFGAT